jgi:tetratricopeptide (TPR) repeat protein
MPQPQVTVLQPLTNLKDVVLPTRPDDEAALLSTWSAAMERALREDRPADAVRLAHVVLRQLPRHLATYARLIRAAWELRRWEEGDAWGRRLLRADPSNPLAWRAVAMAAEQRADRARAHMRWQRAFECDPYEPETRAGLVRTSVDLARLPALNQACLGALHLRGGRWEQAVTQYRTLVAQDSRRLDYQSGLLIALWQSHTQPEAYEMARSLTQAQPYLLIAWTVVDAVGDADDQALARHPLSTMDPDGDYLRSVLVLNAPSRPVRLIVKKADRALLGACGGLPDAVDEHAPADAAPHSA